jgi:hypothetical protein
MGFLKTVLWETRRGIATRTPRVNFALRATSRTGFHYEARPQRREWTFKL